MMEPQTPVRIIGGATSRRGMEGIVTSELPNSRNQGKIPVYINAGRTTGTYWYQAHELEYVAKTPSRAEPSIRIDPEFQALIPPLSESERAQLSSNLLAEGCREPLVIWKGHNILIDGHNRYEICLAHGIEFYTVELDLSSRESVINWIIRNQLGRRNLQPEAVSYLRGKRYNLEKRQGKRTDLTCGKNDQKLEEEITCGKNDSQPKTAELLAAEYKVGSRTIRNDAHYAKAIDSIAEVLGTEVRQQLLSRDKKVSKKDTLKLAKAITKTPQQVRQNYSPGVNIKQMLKQIEAPEPRENSHYVGEVCEILAKDNPRLKGLRGCWCIITSVAEHSCDIQLWNGEIHMVKPEYLRPMNYTETECQQMQVLCARLQRLREVSSEPIVLANLQYLSRINRPFLMEEEEAILGFIETRYGITSAEIVTQSSLTGS